MLRVTLRALLVTVLSAAALHPAAAQNLVGCNAAGPDPAGTFVIPAPAGAVVVLDFTACPGLTIYSVPTPPQPITCPPPTRTVTAFAGPGGAIFTIGGCTLGPLGAAGCATVSVGGGPPAPLRVGSFDLNCAGGVGGGDLSICISDFILSPAEQRSDYNRDGFVGAADLSQLIAVFVGGGSAATCAPRC